MAQSAQKAAAAHARLVSQTTLHGDDLSAFDDANELIKHAEGDLAKIREAYDASLHAKAVSGTLRVQIKNYVENLRSALDFAARGLFENCPGDMFGPCTSSGGSSAGLHKGRISTQ